MLRLAVPNKGSLAESAIDMLKEAGYRTRRDPKELIVADPDNGVEFFYLRPRDIAVYVGSGTVDAGITAATCSSMPAPAPRRSWPSASVPRPSGMPPAPVK